MTAQTRTELREQIIAKLTQIKNDAIARKAFIETDSARLLAERASINAQLQSYAEEVVKLDDVLLEADRLIERTA